LCLDGPRPVTIRQSTDCMHHPTFATSHTKFLEDEGFGRNVLPPYEYQGKVQEENRDEQRDQDDRLRREEVPRELDDEQDEQDEKVIQMREVRHNRPPTWQEPFEWPLHEGELHGVERFLMYRDRIFSPGERYREEVTLERFRVEEWVRNKGTPAVKFFVGLSEPAGNNKGDSTNASAGRERINIIARRNIMRFWEKMKVWDNDNWGIPGKLEGTEFKDPKDDSGGWAWPWQYSVASLRNRPPLHPAEAARRHFDPVTRAISSRQGLRWNEEGYYTKTGVFLVVGAPRRSGRRGAKVTPSLSIVPGSCLGCNAARNL